MKGGGGEDNGEVSSSNTFGNATSGGKSTPQNPMYNNERDQDGIHGDNLNSNTDAGGGSF